MPRNKMQLVEDNEPAEVETEMSASLNVFVKEILDDHLETLPVEVAAALSKDDIAEWAESVQSVVEDGVTSLVENTITVLEADYVEGDDDDDAPTADDLHEEDDADQ